MFKRKRESSGREIKAARQMKKQQLTEAFLEPCIDKKPNHSSKVIVSKDFELILKYKKCRI
jgi:hypothetical protein